MKNFCATIVAAALLTASCGKPDVSGIFVGKDDRAVLFVQLVQDKDQKLSGRIEVAIIGNDGTVSRNAAPETGSVSGHDIVLQPVSFWYGGTTLSGTIVGDTLTLAANGSTVTAKRASLAEYQKAVADLNKKANKIQADATASRAQQAAADQEEQRTRAISGANAGLAQMASILRADTAKLNNAIANIPDFGGRAAANTDRIARMVRAVPSLPLDARNQLRVDANQVEVDTNQIEVERSQYAISLNEIAKDGGDAIAQIDKTCGTSPIPEVAVACVDARGAEKDFKATIAHGRDVFLPLKGRLQAEVRRQAQLAARIG